MTKKKQILIIGFLAFIGTAQIIDSILDFSEPVNRYIWLFEVCIGIFSLSLMSYLIYCLLEQHKISENLNQQLSENQALLENQNEQLHQARAEYSQLIKKQFEEWGLSETEKSTAYLLLKGLSLREIADIREIKEKTVRQQASNLYSKANLPGRHALAAWFFEDML